jgi:hypothetical protein
LFCYESLLKPIKKARTHHIGFRFFIQQSLVSKW